MNRDLPCYVVSDLLPLYQDDILSEQTKKDVDKHLNECEECKKKMAVMKMKIDVQNTNVELKSNLSKNVDGFGSSYSIHFRCMCTDCYTRACCS